MTYEKMNGITTVKGLFGFEVHFLDDRAKKLYLVGKSRAFRSLLRNLR